MDLVVSLDAVETRKTHCLWQESNQGLRCETFNSFVNPLDFLIYLFIYLLICLFRPSLIPSFLLSLLYLFRHISLFLSKCHNKRGDAVLARGRGCGKAYETSLFPIFPDNRMTDDGEVVISTRQQSFPPGSFPTLISVRSLVNPWNHIAAGGIT